jgi:hypothetical protein
MRMHFQALVRGMSRNYAIEALVANEHLRM